MTDLLSKRIDSLPPLPKTLLDLEEFKKSPNKDLEILEDIISQDPLIVATLLKVANSAMFGFSNKVEKSSRAIHLLGVNFTLSIAFGSAIKNSLDTDLGTYGLSSDGFMRIANMSSNLLSLWVGKFDNELKEELVLPMFLLEAGRFVLSGIAIEKGIDNDAHSKFLSAPDQISDTEKEFFKVTSTQVSSAIFDHWNLSEKMVAIIKYVDDLENAPDTYKKESEILNVVKTICNVTEPLSDKFAQEGIAKAKEFGLETRFLEKAIEKMQDRLLEE